MDFSPLSSTASNGRPGEPVRPDRAEPDPDAAVRLHWDLLCGAVLDRLAALAADPNRWPEATRWAAVRDGIAELQALRAVAARASASRAASAERSHAGGRTCGDR